MRRHGWSATCWRLLPCPAGTGPLAQEVPTVIVLDRRRSRPRLVTAHLPCQARLGVSVFGPFLGGHKARRAVAGLHRLYPLAYTGTKVSTAERAVAAKRTVAQADRDRLADVLEAILGREPVAVAQAGMELEALRQVPPPQRRSSWPLAFRRS
jgi:excinuclease ABC subunit C